MFDVAILGGGPAGLSAAIYTARGAVKTAVIDITMFGGQPSNYLELENYPGFSLIGGYDLMEKFEEHVDKFGAEDLFHFLHDTRLHALIILFLRGLRSKPQGLGGNDLLCAYI